jgi:hypothetical protein
MRWCRSCSFCAACLRWVSSTPLFSRYTLSFSARRRSSKVLNAAREDLVATCCHMRAGGGEQKMLAES